VLNFLLYICLSTNDIYIDYLPVQINEAKKMYIELDKDKKSFGLDHCWTILKGEDKWKAKMVEIAELEKLASKKKQKSSTKVSRPRDDGVTNNDEVLQVDAEETVPRKRSDGIKKAKENLRRGGGEACIIITGFKKTICILY
jgi:hypothetical protein